MSSMSAGFKVFLLLVGLVGFCSGQFDTVGLGGSCNYTFQCQTGFCDTESMTCQIPQVSETQPLGECNSTRDCIQGFCYNSQCIIPFKNSTEFAISLGPKTGCAGLITICPPGFSSCYQICDALWYILIAVSFISGLVGFRIKNRLVPVLTLVLPLLVGYFSFVFLGLIVAILEIIFIFYRTSEVEETLPGVEFKELPEGDAESVSHVPSGKKKPLPKKKEEKQEDIEDLPPF